MCRCVCPARRRTAWKEDTTHVGNYSVVGIVSDPNAVGKTGRNSKAPLGASGAEEPEDTSVAATAIVGGDEVRGLLGQVRSTGLAPPKRLTTKQRRVVGALVAEHGHDLNAMARDRKLNAMQHTIAQLRELVVSAAYPDLLESGRRWIFRAPIKTSLKGRNKVR